MRYTPQNNPTIFGKILRQEIPSKVVYEDDLILAFHDIAPKAPIHIVIIPKQHLEGIQDAQPGDEQLLGHLMVAANTIATQLGLNEPDKGYRLITNAGKGAGQEVPHLHLHLLGGTYPLPGF